MFLFVTKFNLAVTVALFLAALVPLTQPPILGFIFVLMIVLRHSSHES